jgi:hypothetical protein
MFLLIMHRYINSRTKNKIFLDAAQFSSRSLEKGEKDNWCSFAPVVDVSYCSGVNKNNFVCVAQLSSRAFEKGEQNNWCLFVPIAG